ncbi:hypothetical protein Mapa_010496 [Marchantia paleacea]|nr:hypothetical protein Mapa_010496 [Marchantia paleacea]
MKLTCMISIRFLRTRGLTSLAMLLVSDQPLCPSPPKHLTLPSFALATPRPRQASLEDTKIWSAFERSMTVRSFIAMNAQLTFSPEILAPLPSMSMSIAASSQRSNTAARSSLTHGHEAIKKPRFDADST